MSGVIVERRTLLFLRRVRVVKRHVHLRMAHDRLNDSGVRLFVHQEAGEAVPPQIVKPEATQPISFFAEQFVLAFNQDARPYGSRPDVILHQHRSGARLFTDQFDRRKNIIILGAVNGLAFPGGKNAQCKMRNFHPASAEPGFCALLKTEPGSKHPCAPSLLLATN